jgi:hypothetical protein
LHVELIANSVLVTLHKVSVKHKKHYAYPSQLKILELLEKWRGVRRCRRTLNYWLRAVEDADLIRRKRRIGYSRDYGLLFHSSLYMITLRGYYTLLRAGVDVRERIREIIESLKDRSKREDAGRESGRRLKDLVEVVNRAVYREGMT